MPQEGKVTCSAERTSLRMWRSWPNLSQFTVRESRRALPISEASATTGLTRPQGLRPHPRHHPHLRGPSSRQVSHFHCRLSLIGDANDTRLYCWRIPMLHGRRFVTWLNWNVEGFDSSIDRVEQAAQELTERGGLLRRIGELGTLEMLLSLEAMPSISSGQSRSSPAKPQPKTPCTLLRGSLPLQGTLLNVPVPSSMLSLRRSPHREL